MTDKPDWEKRMDYWILEAEKEKNRADGAAKRLYFLETENKILKNNIKVLVDTQKESESLIAELKQSKRFELIRKIREKADKDTYALAEECVRLEKELTEANAEIARIRALLHPTGDTP
ncbi:hypothetical protein [Paenibacillus polymyxa]|uniref:hypothetical protein n=1 Tax=Paenibacillus polymyxa TaxID=1406 RepID=UPI000845F8B6|nr:hypothetical protein [Paenibacillus polymyxa]AOK88543.1 hypothetical protein AOU00_01345 [Paenibacillus polymyxa]